jgi:peroxiredoxin Q/BCP
MRSAIRALLGALRQPRRTPVLRPGDPAPDFTGRDHRGQTIALADYRGKTVVLWFFPKADTPG